MTASDFAAWVSMMRETRGWSQARCSRALGCGLNQVRIWQTTEPPPYIGLACTAIAVGLPPWPYHLQQEHNR